MSRIPLQGYDELKIYSWNAEIRVVRGLKYLQEIREAVTRPNVQHSILPRMKYIKICRRFSLSVIGNFLLNKAQYIIRFSHHFHKTITSGEFTLNMTIFSQLNHFSMMRKIDLKLGGDRNKQCCNLKYSQLKAVLNTPHVQDLSLDLFHPRVFLTLKNYPKLKTLHFICASSEFFTHLTALDRILLSNKRNEPISFYFLFDINEPLETAPFASHPLLQEIKTIKIRNSLEPSALPRVLRMADDFSKLSEFSYKDTKGPFSFQCLKNMEKFDSLQVLDLSVCPTSNSLYGEDISFFDCLALPNNLRDLTLDFIDVDPMVLDDFNSSQKLFKSLSELTTLKSFTFNLAIYKMSPGLKQLRCLKLIKEFLVSIHWGLEELSLSFFDPILLSSNMSDNELITLISKFENLKELSLQLPIQVAIYKKTEKATAFTNNKLKKLVLKDCMWFLEFFKSTSLEKLTTLTVSLSERLNFTQLQSLLRLVKGFPLLSYLNLALCVKEKNFISWELFQEIISILTTLKHLKNLYLKLPDLLIDDAQARVIYQTFQWKKFLENSFLIIGHYDFVRGPLKSCSFNKLIC